MGVGSEIPARSVASLLLRAPLNGRKAFQAPDTDSAISDALCALSGGNLNISGLATRM
jgi:hypothetical protein